MNRQQKSLRGLSLAMANVLNVWNPLRLFTLFTLLAVLTVSSLFSVPVEAQVKTENALTTDPALEKRVLILSENLRCLVCQNQTIADSNADLAIDLRNQVRIKMAAGWSDEKIMEYMVARYGDFVLYSPPFKTITVLLWVGPFALLLLGGFFFIRKLKNQTVQAEPSAARLQEAAQLLGTKEKESA
jgi:cytochrome c-type biogenesis protein CcmH